MSQEDKFNREDTEGETSLLIWFVFVILAFIGLITVFKLGYDLVINIIDKM